MGLWVHGFRQLNLNYDYIFSDLKNNGYVSRYVLENLKHQFIFGLEHKLFWKIYNHFNMSGIINVKVKLVTGSLIRKICWENNGKPFIYFKATDLTECKIYGSYDSPCRAGGYELGLNLILDFNIIISINDPIYR